jgi:hypothetical protein
MVSIFKRAAEVLLFFVSFIILLEFIWDYEALHLLTNTLISYSTIIAAFTLGIGGINLVMRHSRIILQRRGEWLYSIVLFSTLVLFVLTGLITGSTSSEWYNWIYTTIVPPITSTLYGANTFWIATSAYRSFRARTWEAMMLLVAAIFIMFMIAPIGSAIHPVLPQVGSLIFDIAVNTGMRGLLIGIGIGVLAFGLRIIIAENKTALGGTEE